MSIFRCERCLPPPVRILARVILNQYRESRVCPLGGVLSGCRMRGIIPSSYLEGTYEPEFCEIITQIVQRGWICVDVGAYMGYFTLLFAKLVGPRGRVIAFEAHPENAAWVRSNVRLNGMQAWVKVENMAVLDGSNERTKLFPGRRHSSAEWNTVGHEVEGNPTQPELEVPGTLLDDYFPPGSRVDLVKIDIEGAEGLALSGMRRLLQESRPFVLVEFHDETGWTGRQHLLAACYELYDVVNARWLSESDTQRVYHCLAVPRGRSGEFVA